jgi:chromate transporter
MRRLLIRERGWLDDAGFAQDWTLSRTAPGLTLIGLTALIGRRVDGDRGMVLALAGLLGPSVSITVLLTAAFVVIRDLPIIQEAIDGIAPATIGLTLAMQVIFTRSALRAGRARYLDTAVILVAAVIGYASDDLSVPLIVAGAVLGWALLGEDRAATAGPRSIPDADDETPEAAGAVDATSATEAAAGVRDT